MDWLDDVLLVVIFLILVEKEVKRKNAGVSGGKEEKMNKQQLQQLNECLLWNGLKPLTLTDKDIINQILKGYAKDKDLYVSKLQFIEHFNRLLLKCKGMGQQKAIGYKRAINDMVMMFR